MADALPEIDLNQPAEDIRKQFEKALNDIRVQLQSLLIGEGNRAELLKAEREIEKILAELDAYIDANTTSFVEVVGVTAAFLALYNLGKPAASLDVVKLSRKEKALLGYASQTLAADLSQVVSNLNRQTRAMLKRAYFDELARTGSRTKRGLSKELKALLDEADIAILDKVGRRWKTSTYVDLVVKENLMRVQREVEVLESLRHGNGLAYVSYNPKTTDGCKQHQYKIVKVSPEVNSPYPYYLDLSHIFHPNCRHYLIPIRNLENLPAQVKLRNSLTE